MKLRAGFAIALATGVPAVMVPSPLSLAPADAMTRSGNGSGEAMRGLGAPHDPVIWRGVMPGGLDGNLTVHLVDHRMRSSAEVGDAIEVLPLGVTRRGGAGVFEVRLSPEDPRLQGMDVEGELALFIAGLSDDGRSTFLSVAVRFDRQSSRWVKTSGFSEGLKSINEARRALPVDRLVFIDDVAPTASEGRLKIQGIASRKRVQKLRKQFGSYECSGAVFVGKNTVTVNEHVHYNSNGGPSEFWFLREAGGATALATGFRLGANAGPVTVTNTQKVLWGDAISNTVTAHASPVRPNTKYKVYSQFEMHSWRWTCQATSSIYPYPGTTTPGIPLQEVAPGPYLGRTWGQHEPAQVPLSPAPESSRQIIDPNTSRVITNGSSFGTETGVEVSVGGTWGPLSINGGFSVTNQWSTTRKIGYGVRNTTDSKYWVGSPSGVNPFTSRMAFETVGNA